MSPRPEPGTCGNCGAPLGPGRAACAACGTLARPGRAISPPAGFFGIVLGVFAGPFLAFVAGLVGLFAVGEYGSRTSPSGAAEYIAIQLVPVVVALGLGQRLLRARRATFGWFCVTTGIMAFLPAAACDTVGIVATHAR